MIDNLYKASSEQSNPKKYMLHCLSKNEWLEAGLHSCLFFVVVMKSGDED
jgi:hypothetical protein